MFPTNDIESTVVVGAGAAGLIAAFELQQVGILPRIFERASRVGDQWRARHPRLTLNTHRDLSHLPNLRYPTGTPAFPKRDAVVNHLQEFVAQKSIAIDFGVEVGRISVVDGNYHLATNKGGVVARNVVIATGRDRNPIIPAWPGIERFRGKLIHAAHFGGPQEYDGTRVLVIGSGNSGFDVLNHLAAQKPSAIWLSSRHGPTLVPKRLFGVTVHRLSPLLACLPTRLADAALAATSYVAFGDLRRFGMGKLAAGGATRLREGTALASDDGAVRAIKSGTIKVMPEVQSFDEGQVYFSDGQSCSPDIVISATGYVADLERLVGNLDLLDKQGRALINGSQQLSHLPGIYFIGMRASIVGDIGSAKVQGREIAKAVRRRQRHEIA
ncbi:dimethylaniline monooxygenase [Rhizobium leguminosarum bv. trifolii]|uniref:Dimethylaniline monooxygenase n=1 Tax=Rhizobium leguminosarum bv. trifolii TaxID=386 RepID=A0A3E1B5J0_RHILT|nr:NAD(P)/FAD-dependent oxidoreductase [Rhizobium leguminosarum]RFB85039.1 dimethylaniline monooxygenase [Rhizobium leguminosarum bv. trifolii]RFB86104.1 dimethylaniline monooxygenase [Rhizobium leguminosarum bv. trifolii]